MVTLQEYEARDNAFDWDGLELAEMEKLIWRTGEWLESLFGVHHANEGMKAVYASLFEVEVDQRAKWRDVWREKLNDQDFGYLGMTLQDLAAFAFWGLRPDHAFLAKSEDLIAKMNEFVGGFRIFLDRVPTNWTDYTAFRRTVLAAEARLSLDNGQDVSPEGLASLSEVSLKSIKNLLTPKGGPAELRLNSKGEISAGDALRWLHSRGNFKTSIWRTDVASELEEGAREKAKKDVGEVVFVPVARDGSWFEPENCRGERGYVIGNKGAEEVIENYFEALARLLRMQTPAWRRLTGGGVWIIVYGVGWQRKIVNELESFGQQRGAASP